jgi:hypothetical protein
MSDVGTAIHQCRSTGLSKAIICVIFFFLQVSPANTELEMLSTDDQDISPLAMTHGFDYSVSPLTGVSPAPSDLDALVDGGPLTAPFDFTD